MSLSVISFLLSSTNKRKPNGQKRTHGTPEIFITDDYDSPKVTHKKMNYTGKNNGSLSLDVTMFVMINDAWTCTYHDAWTCTYHDALSV